MSEEKKEKVFAKGLFFTQKDISGNRLISMSVKVDDFIEFLNQHKNDSGYVNINIWESRKEGSKYSHNAELNDWKPDPSKRKDQPSTPIQKSQPTTSVDDDLPF